MPIIVKSLGKCTYCGVNLESYYVGENSEKFEFCISCPHCHVVYDLIDKKKLTPFHENKSEMRKS